MLQHVLQSALTNRLLWSAATHQRRYDKKRRRRNLFGKRQSITPRAPVRGVNGESDTDASFRIY